MPRPAVIKFTLAGPDGLMRSQAVAVRNLAVEQIRDRGKADVRVRADIEAAADQELGRTHLVEEHERTDHRLPTAGNARRTSKPPMSRVRGTITCLDCVAGFGITRDGIVIGELAHVAWPFCCPVA